MDACLTKHSISGEPCSGDPAWVYSTGVSRPVGLANRDVVRSATYHDT